MRIVGLGTIAIAALVAGCDRGASVDLTNATPEQVAEEVRKSGAAEELQRPGKWTIQTQLVDVRGPGLPPEQVAMMRKMMDGQKPVERCVTADDLKQATALLGENPSGCTFSHYRLANGSIDSEARCSTGPMQQHLRIEGTYSGDTTDTTMTSTTKGGGQDMTMVMNVKSRRVGPC